MDKELFDFLMSEADFTKEDLEVLYNMDKEGKIGRASCRERV